MPKVDPKEIASIDPDEIMETYPNFVILFRRCPKCFGRLIKNSTGIECGEFGCDYDEW